MTTPLRVGLVGAGAISKHHLPHLIALGAEVYVYSEAGADDLVRRYGGSVVSSYEELLDLVDVIDIVTPTFTHFDYARRALEQGKDVISEKPITRTDSEAEYLTSVVGDAGRALFPAHVVRFFPEYRRLKDAVDENLLGDLAVLRFSRSGAFPTRSPWYADSQLSGGIIMDLMIHDLDIARWIAGDVVTVSATSVSVDDEGSPVQAAHVLLTHACGAISHIAGVWGPGHIRFSTEYSVTGTRGTLAHSSLEENNYTADLSDHSRDKQLTPQSDPDDDPYFLELRAFLTALQGGEEPPVTLADGVAAVRIASAAIESLETGQPVNLEIAGEVLA